MPDELTALQQTTVTLPYGTWVLRRLRYKETFQLASRAASYFTEPFDKIPQAFQTAAWVRATIELATVQAPPQWDWEQEDDDSRMTELFTRYQAWNDSFRPGVAVPAGAAGPGTE